MANNSMKWQLMHHAPKDGSIVDLWVKGESSDIHFYCGVWAPEGRIADCVYLENKWRPKAGLTKMLGLVVEPLYWMRIEPPS